MINSPNIFSFKETATTKVEDSEENSGSGTTEAVESEESGSSEESGESEEPGDWEESGESGESGDYEDSEESGDSSISKRDEIPKEQGQCTENIHASHILISCKSCANYLSDAVRRSAYKVLRVLLQKKYQAHLRRSCVSMSNLFID